MADKELIEKLRMQIGALEAQADLSMEAPGSARASSSGRKGARGGDPFEGGPFADAAFRAGKPASDARSQEKDASAALSKIVRILNAGEKCSNQVRARLLQDGFAPDVADEALQKAIGYGIVDDTRYAEFLMRSRIAQGRGVAGIERELEQNRIDPLSVPGWPEDYLEGAGDEVDRAMELIRKHPPRAKNARDAAYRKLVQKGYSSSVAASAARQWADSPR